MQKITYVPPGGSLENPSERVEFSLSPPYIFGTVSGISGADTTVLSTAVPGIDGALVQGIRTEPREISCSVYVKGEERKKMYENRFQLIQMLAPRKESGMLYYTNDYTTMRIEARPLNSPNFTERIMNYNQAELRFWCPFPYWEGMTEKSGQMAYTGKGFTFEFMIAFASIADKTELWNAGSIATPVTISIRGPANNPCITNQRTGEFIRLNHELQEGEILTITTQKGDKSVKISSAEDQTPQNAFHYIDLNSTFFQLEPGSNTLVYESDDETRQTQVTIRYRELYAGV